jgi:predicted nucleotide-binding protein
MLLTKDDEFLGEESFAAPRDNVIFEMGLFRTLHVSSVRENMITDQSIARRKEAVNH